MIHKSTLDCGLRERDLQFVLGILVAYLTSRRLGIHLWQNNPNNPMKILNSILSITLLALVHNCEAQAFVNLDFESANLSVIPSGQFGSLVPITDALPGWTGYVGTIQLTQVLQNNATLGAPSIDILGPNWNAINIIEGQYTVVLQPGGVGPSFESASISQSGMVPIYARSLQFKAVMFSPCSVSLGGQTLSLIPLQTGANYTLYGADISSFAGQVENLAITALAAPNSADYFDSFVFSPSTVPEANAFGLFALGGLFLGLSRRRK